MRLRVDQLHPSCPPFVLDLTRAVHMPIEVTRTMWSPSWGCRCTNHYHQESRRFGIQSAQRFVQRWYLLGRAPERPDWPKAFVFGVCQLWQLSGCGASDRGSWVPCDWVVGPVPTCGYAYFLGALIGLGVDQPQEPADCRFIIRLPPRLLMGASQGSVGNDNESVRSDESTVVGGSDAGVTISDRTGEGGSQARIRELESKLDELVQAVRDHTADVKAVHEQGPARAVNEFAVPSDTVALFAAAIKLNDRVRAVEEQSAPRRNVADSGPSTSSRLDEHGAGH